MRSILDDIEPEALEQLLRALPALDVVLEEVTH
jgi:hypothetical protein